MRARGALLLLSLFGCGDNTAGAPDDLAIATVVDLTAVAAADLTIVAAADLSTSPVDMATQPLADLTTTSDGGPQVQPGQCYLSSQCGPSRICNKALPGGLCDGCMSFGANCKSGFDDECIGGNCARQCSVDGDCLPGWRCASFMGSKYCALKTCSTSQDCGPHLECRTSGIGLICQRFLCSPGTCPTGTTCLNAVCVEDYLTF